MNDFLIFLIGLILIFIQIGRAWQSHRDYYDLKKEIKRTQR